MTRKLVTLRKVEELKEIPGADEIEAARVDGWWCVVKRGEFKVGDSGLYFECDCFLPAADERFKFLEKNFRTWEGKLGARIKTIKLRGQLSQGLLLPERDFPEIKQYAAKLLFGMIDLTQPGNGVYEHDYAEDLKVEKWERSLHPSLSGQARGNFPHFIPKTDEERIQNLTKVIDQYWDESFEASYKMDGSSCTMYFLQPESKYNDKEEFPLGRFGVCSRNLDLKETEGNAFWAIARKIQAEEKLDHEQMDGSYAIQGELVGPAIQGNYEKMAENDFYVFKVWDIEEQRMLTPMERRRFCTENGFKHVFLEGFDVKLGAYCDRSVDRLLERADGPGMNLGVKREGLVFKHNNSDFSFKVISNSYLLKEKE